MARSKAATNSKAPAFATGGSFQALTVDDLESSDSDHQDNNDHQITEKTPLKTTQALLSPQAKKTKAKQRTKDRKRKSEDINQLLSSANDSSIEPSSNLQTKPSVPISSYPSRQTKKNNPIIANPRPDLDHTPQSVKPKLDLEKLKISKADDQVVVVRDLVVNPITPITSPSISTTSTISTGYDDGDDDDDEDQEKKESEAMGKSSLPSTNSKLELSEIVSQPSRRSKESEQLLLNRPATQNMLSTSNSNSPDTARPSSATPTATHQLRPTPPHSGSFKNHLSSVSNASQSAAISQYGADHTPGKRWQTVLTRVFWSLIMVAGFITLMALGHLYLIILVFIIQLLVFREVTNLFEVGYKAFTREHAKKEAQVSAHHHSTSPTVKERKRGKKDRSSKVLSWYFFCVANYFLYGESIIYYFKHIVFIDEYLLPFARHHRFISLLLYLIGFLGFVTNLDRVHLRRQFGLFSWIHMSLLLLIVFGQFMVNNILEGLIWFWVPACLVIMNDVAAYVFGMLFGKHQLIKLSPKKTVEGFVGGFFVTVIFGVLWGSLFMGWNYMICPVKDLTMTAFSETRCEPSKVFIWRSLDLEDVMMSRIDKMPFISPVNRAYLAWLPNQIWWTPFQLHCLVLGTFAGLVAPFGGFFASGFKRAFNIKDFGDTIPGHGGLTDRFDCQFIMGLFTYFYYSSLVKEAPNISVGSVLEIILTNLNDQQQLEVFLDLKRSLSSKGIL